MSMKEKLKVFNLKGSFLKVQNRNSFYSEIKKEFYKTGKISKKVGSIRLLLMNSNGRIYLQKRSPLKSENAGLYDKTVGGHVLNGETSNMTVVRECAEELGFPASVLSNKEFSMAINNTDLQIVGIFKKITEIKNFESVRIEKTGNKFVQPFISSFFIGYYDGAIRFTDGESSGIEVFSLKELDNEIKKNPSKFTEDIKFMVSHFRHYLQPIKNA